MRMLRHVIFVVITAVFLTAPVGVMLLKSVQVPIPSWIGDSQSRLQLEGRKAQAMPEFSLGSIRDGSFQEEVEYAISDSVPMRNDALLAAAFLQRVGISQMAYLKGYTVYPSYFGSKYLYEPEERAVWHEPIKADPDYSYEPRMRAFGEGVAAVAGRHPDIRFCIMMPAGGAMPAVNPAYSLITNPQHPEPLLMALQEGVGGCPNVTVVSNIGYYEDKDEYFTDYCRTDHHWNAHGCIRSYNEAARAMGFAEIQIEPETEICQSIGSYARYARVVVTESNKDIAETFPGVYFLDNSESNDEPRAVPVDDHAWFNPPPGDRFFDFYGNYFKQVDTYIGPGSDEALLICDSFAAPLLAPLASNYGVLHRVDDLFQRQGGTSLEAYIDEMNPDDIWIVGIPADMMALVKREPSYFEAN